LAWDKVLEGRNDFIVLHRNHNRDPNACPICFTQRMTETMNIGQLLLAFLLTSCELEWYERLPESGSETPLDWSKVFATGKCAPLLTHFPVIFEANAGVFTATWQDYLLYEQFGVAETAPSFWTRHQGIEYQSGLGDPVISFLALSQMALALTLTRMPSGQAVVERAFSHLKFIIGTRSRQMKSDLLDAIILVRLAYS
jgi:hypothetical protein